MSRQWVTTSDGVRLRVQVTGPRQASTIVCVHGYPDNSSLWEGVRARLGDRFRVVSYDVRGAGESTKPRARAAYRLDRLAADLAEVIDEVAPDGKVHLLAHDWGAIQSWHAVTGPWLRGRVASFTSISGPCLDHAGRWFRAQLRPSPRRLRAALRQLVHSTYIAFFQLPVLPELAWRTGLLARLLKRADPDAAVPELSDGLHGLRLYRQNMLPRLTRPGRRHAEVPVQVIAPVADAFVTAPLQTQIQRWVPDLRVRKIPGGHWVVRGDPARIATATAEFVEHVQGGPQSRALRRSRVNPAPRGRFEGRLVVVTGAGSGIGNATARAFAAQGADVVLADIDADALGAASLRVRRAGGQALPYLVDVSDAEAMTEFASAVRAEHGVADIVVNNAGIGVAGPFLDTEVRQWQRVIDVNLWGVIHGCRLFGGQLAERGEGGHIVNVASVAAYLPTKVLPAYSATKAAVLMLSQCLRAELAAHGIGVSAICPGMVNTNIAGTTTFTGVGEDEQQARRAAGSRLFARRAFPPERVAADILRAVRRDSAVVATTAEARAALALSRLTPGLLRAAARKLPG